MKKLKLNQKDVGEILTREQLKQVFGGSGNCDNNGWHKCMCSPDGPWQSVYITDCSWPADAMVECTTVVRCQRL